MPRTRCVEPVTPTLNPRDYEVIWIAPLEIEARAAFHLLDERHEGKFPDQRGGEYIFRAGSMCGRNIVIATLPTGHECATASAAGLASQIKKTFPYLWFGLLVGVGTGLPNLNQKPPRDIRLGDVLVGLPEGDDAGIIAFELGKETAIGFELLRRGHVLARTERIVLSAIGSIKHEAPYEAQCFRHYYDAVCDKDHADGTFADPGQDADILYLTKDDGSVEPIERGQRPQERRTKVWYGSIGSGSRSFEDAQKRDKLRDKYGLIGLENGAAGIMNLIPVGVIRGVCDYGDAQKNKEWQPYAAAMAAAYAKALLAELMPQPVLENPVSGSTTSGLPIGPHFHIPLPRNARFIGRESILATLDERFFGELACHRLALVGLGGVGKTQITLRFVYGVKESRPEYSIFWVPIVSDGTIEQAFADIARKIGLQKNSDDEDVKELVCRHLSSEEAGKWLLVIDNADDHELVFGPDGIEQFLPYSDQGLILLTTRSSQIAEKFAQADVIEVERMNREEATKFFKKSLNPKQVPQDEEIVSQLLARLTYLPLAIAQAAAFLRQTRMPVHKYLALLQSSENEVVKVLRREFKDNTRYPSSTNAVATTWLVSFEQIRRSEKAAFDLLLFLSCIEPKAIPESILAKFNNVEERQWAIGVLCGYSFLVRRGDGDIFDLHSLVHVAMRAWIAKQGIQQQVMDEAISYLGALFPSDSSIDQAPWRECLPQALQVLSGSNAQDTEERADLCMRVGWCLHRDRRDKEAMACFQDAYRYWRSYHPEGHSARTIAEEAIGRICVGNQQVKTAIEMLERVVAVRRKTLVEDDVSRMASEHELARAYLEDGRVQEAIDILERLMLLQSTLVEDHPISLRTKYQLALAYSRDKQAGQAIDLIEHVVKVRSQSPEPDDPVIVEMSELLDALHTESEKERQTSGFDSSQ